MAEVAADFGGAAHGRLKQILIHGQGRLAGGLALGVHEIENLVGLAIVAINVHHQSVGHGSCCLGNS